MRCRICEEPIRSGEPYHLYRVEGGHRSGSSYHHEYAHKFHEDETVPSAPKEQSLEDKAVFDRIALCLRVCSGIGTEELSEIAEDGGFKAMIATSK